MRKSSFTQALELKPKNFDAIVGLGVAYRGLDQKEKAEEQYHKAKEMSANRPEPYYTSACSIRTSAPARSSI